MAEFIAFYTYSSWFPPQIPSKKIFFICVKCEGDVLSASAHVVVVTQTTQTQYVRKATVLLINFYTHVLYYKLTTINCLKVASLLALVVKILSAQSDTATKNAPPFLLQLTVIVTAAFLKKGHWLNALRILFRTIHNRTRQKGLQSNSDPMCFLFLFAGIAGKR